MLTSGSGPNLLSAQKGGLKLELKRMPLLQMGKAMLYSVQRLQQRCKEQVMFCTIACNHLGPLLILYFIFRMRERRGSPYQHIITS